MTDEELNNLDDDAFEEMQTKIDDNIENAEEVIETTVGEPEVSDGSEEETNSSEETEEVEEEEEVVETEEDTPADNEPDPEATNGESPENTEETTEDEDEDELDENFNYEASFNELMKPLNVSGKETEVKSIDDMRNLANMGIDYSRKMRDIKPLRAIGETLTQAGIMKDGQVDEAVLMRLVDINNGNPEALAQLMKEKEIDPLDMETEDISYAPTATMATQQNVEIQDVERELVNRNSVDLVIGELEKLDDASKQFFNETPSNLLKLDDDIKSGSYEKIMGAVRYEKDMGRLTEMSDMEAYIQMAQSGGSEKPQTPAPTQDTRPSVAKRKAAGITKRAPARKNVQKEYDFVNMSDEEFEKLAPTDTMY